MRSILITAALSLALFSCNSSDQQKNTSEEKQDTFKNESAAGKAEQPAETNESASSPSTTFKYEPGVSTVTGTITSETFFGPPGFGETPQQDSKEKIFILKLDQPITVVASAGTDEFNVTRENITELQLSSPEIQVAPLENKKVKLTGMFFGAHTGHHYTDVLMTVQKAESL